MAGRHRSRNKSIQIIRTATVAAKDCKRVTTTQFHVSQWTYWKDITYAYVDRQVGINETIVGAKRYINGYTYTHIDS